MFWGEFCYGLKCHIYHPVADETLILNSYASLSPAFDLIPIFFVDRLPFSFSRTFKAGFVVIAENF